MPSSPTTHRPRAHSPKRPWTDDETNILIRDYSTLGTAAIARAMGRSWDSVKLKAARIGLAGAAESGFGSGIESHMPGNGPRTPTTRLISPEVKSYREHIKNASKGKLGRSRRAVAGSDKNSLARALDQAISLGGNASLPERLMLTAWNSARRRGVILTDVELAKRFGVDVGVVSRYADSLSGEGLWPVKRRVATHPAVLNPSSIAPRRPGDAPSPATTTGELSRHRLRQASWVADCEKCRAGGNPLTFSPERIDRRAKAMRRLGAYVERKHGAKRGAYHGHEPNVSKLMSRWLSGSVVVRRGGDARQAG